MSFSPTFTDQSLQNAINKFQAHINKVIADTKDVCLSCSLFIPSKTSQLVYEKDPIFIFDINSHAFTALSFDQYGYFCGNFLFCKSCFHHIKELKSLKFDATNIINISIYQIYPNVPKKLMLIEEAVIAYAHPIISIFNLKPSGTSLLASYYQRYSHTVILPPSPAFWLDLLPSNAFRLYKFNRVVWAIKKPHTTADILLLEHVKKEKVLNALL